MANPLLIKAGIDLVIGLVGKMKSKPKTGIKEASAAGIISMVIALNDQYSIGGIEAIDPTTVAGLASLLWVLVMRLYQKHKED